MIINQQSNIFNAGMFAQGLERVGVGVVRVSTERAVDTKGPITFVTSGWMITDTLVVLPSDLADGQKPEKYTCHTFDQSLDAYMVVTIPGLDQNEGLSLLQLSKPLPGRALHLSVKNAELNSNICIPQYPASETSLYFSLGLVTNIDNIWVDYNADTEPGSGGSPIMDAKTWTVIGMHMLALTNARLNRGLRLDPLLDMLKNTPHWKEIAAYHRIADISSTAPRAESIQQPAPDASDPVLMRAALSWNFKPAELEAKDSELLQPFIIDPSSDTWIMKAGDRQRILRAAGSLEVLRSFRVAPAPGAHPAQAVIDKILDGPPYRLNDVADAELPYWLQAVRWFAGVIPDLPTAADVNAVIERKKIRGQLSGVITGFLGRSTELTALKNWFNSEEGPLVLTGIGGIGKSALIAFFACSLPQETVLFWLDFDRADLVPDDTWSVLKALIEQASVQIEGFKAESLPAQEDRWDETARELGRRISSATANAAPPLLILDGFEVAQHVRQYHEIWMVLEQVLSTAPGLKILISGRAPVKSLVLGGKDAVLRRLEGLQPEDVKMWLQTNGIEKEEVVSEIMKLADGIPLRLKLAAHYLSKGLDSNLPQDLPKALVEGYLYRRILDRVVDPDLIPMVKDLLVLRKCSRKMIAEIFSDALPPGLDSEQVYMRLSREMALVGEGENLYPSFVALAGRPDVLELRPEVRTAALRLLEMDDAKRVHDTDVKAADWYAKQDLTDIDNVTELLYHRLRLGQLEEAKKIWRIECAPLLKNAVDDLPESAKPERAWLAEQVGQDTAEISDSLAAWEIEAALEIRNRFMRGIYDGFGEILSAHSQRTDGSPLILYDAWNCFRQNNIKDAITLLEGAKAVEGPIQRARNILYAFLLLRQERWDKADEVLQSIENEKWWADRSGGRLEMLAVRAARVRLMVDIRDELKIFEAIKNNEDTDVVSMLGQFLTKMDIVTPLLNNIFASEITSESFGPDLFIPETEADLPAFRQKVQQKRFTRAPFALSLEDEVSLPGTNSWWERIGKANNAAAKPVEMRYFPILEARKIAYMGYRRWKMGTSDLMLNAFCKEAENIGTVDPFTLSIIATLVAFRGVMVNIRWMSNSSIDSLLRILSEPGHYISVPPPNIDRVLLLDEYVRLEKKFDPSNPRTAADLISDYIKKGDASGSTFAQFIAKIEWPAMVSLVLYLYGPDPLEMLLKRMLGFEDYAQLD